MHLSLIIFQNIGFVYGNHGNDCLSLYRQTAGIMVVSLGSKGGNMQRSILVLLAMALFAAPAFADPQFVRWTLKEDKNADLNHIIEVLNQKTGLSLKDSDFALLKAQERDLANHHFAQFSQVAGGLPIDSLSIRVWTDLKTHEAVQVEALVDSPQKSEKLSAQMKHFGITTASLKSPELSQKVMEVVRAEAKRNQDDPRVSSVRFQDQWQKGELVRVVKAKGRRGEHRITISLKTLKVVGAEYAEFPQGELAVDPNDEISVPAQVFPIYEEVERTGKILERSPALLRYIKGHVLRAQGDIYLPLKDRKYLEAQYNPIAGDTPEGQALGFWSMNWIKSRAQAIRDALPASENTFSQGGVILEGRYATVSLHPEVVNKFSGLNFTPAISSQFKPDWRETAVGTNSWEMVPMGALLGRPLASFSEAWNRPARRLPMHDPVSYINDGFDEIQVYYGVTQLVDSLRAMGYTDPELSTRPFNAFLYDPDISMRDNAYYTDDTINFTTYSPNQPNMARDNPTIWHELGHGVMDRLMGDAISLADTGGLSEGMADFIAALVIADVSENKPFEGSDDFRIINKTGFFLTNEVHDDGEAYGGAMKDFLDAAMAQMGKAGLVKVTDLTLEAMRLSRNHPGLTAQDWFNHLFFADELGHPGVRAPGELAPLLSASLAGRNFSFEGKEPASFRLLNGEQEVVSGGPGSRQRPIPLSLGANEKADYRLDVQLKSTETYQFNYPVTVKVQLVGGPIQGAIHWEGEEQSPQTYQINSESELLSINLSARGTCDYENRDDGSCVDFAYVQVFNHGETKPQAKKRFYLRVKTKQP
jgi:hypothetical protein